MGAGVHDWTDLISAAQGRVGIRGGGEGKVVKGFIISPPFFPLLWMLMLVLSVWWICSS